MIDRPSPAAPPCHPPGSLPACVRRQCAANASLTRARLLPPSPPGPPAPPRARPWAPSRRRWPKVRRKKHPRNRRPLRPGNAEQSGGRCRGRRLTSLQGCHSHRPRGLLRAWGQTSRPGHGGRARCCPRGDHAPRGPLPPSRRGTVGRRCHRPSDQRRLGGSAGAVVGNGTGARCAPHDVGHPSRPWASKSSLASPMQAALGRWCPAVWCA